MTVYVQQTTASASSSANNAGLASFDSTDFDVDGNGYVTFVGSAGTETLTGNTGGAVGPTTGNINTVGTGSITVVGNPGTSTTTVQLTGLTNHDVLVGAGTATITNVSPSTAGFVLTSNGVSADPSFQAPATSGTVTSVSVVSANGFAGTVANPTTTPAITLTTTITGVLSGNGTAISGSAITQHDVLVGGTSNAITSVSPSTAGFVLTSNGTGADPSFQAASGGSGITTIDGDTGSITGSTVSILAGISTQNSGSTVEFVNSGTMSTFNVTDSNGNTIIGNSSGTNSGGIGGNNTSVGSSSFSASLSGCNNNSIFGCSSFTSNTSGSQNTVCGSQAGTINISGNGNTYVGCLAGQSTSDTNYSICIGSCDFSNPGAGASATGSSNIILGSLGGFAVGNTIQIGDAGSGDQQINACYIAGINNVDSSGFTSPLAVFVDSSTGQLGFGSGGGGGGITTINGDSGSITGSTVTIFANQASRVSGASVYFVNSGTTSTLRLTDDNVNTFIGTFCGSLTASGLYNTALGFNTVPVISTGAHNTASGNGSGLVLADGSFNSFFGDNAGATVISETNNTHIGYNSTGSGSYNILIGGNNTGVSTNGDSNICMQNVGATESNTIRIGTQGSGTAEQNVCYIAGITGGAGTTAAVFVDTNGLLGTTVSSRKYKENIIPIVNSKILNLQPVSFNYKAPRASGIQYGLIAEDVAEVFPELVQYKDGEPESVAYHMLPVLLLAEIQKLRKELDELKLKMSA